eukprot:2884152-Rhodomonas_salina.2
MTIPVSVNCVLRVAGVAIVMKSFTFRSTSQAQHPNASSGKHDRPGSAYYDAHLKFGHDAVLVSLDAPRIIEPLQRILLCNNPNATAPVYQLSSPVTAT